MNSILNEGRLVVVLFCFLLPNLQCYGMNYVPLNRAGQSSQQLATTLHQNILTANNSTEVARIIATEIGSNNIACQLESQVAFLNQHLREHGHWIDAYMLWTYGAAPDSRYATTARSAFEFDRMISDLLNLLLSGRVSFSVGALQGPFSGRRKEYGFVLFANITNHGITNLSAVSGQYRGANTNYLKIVFRFMDRLSSDLNTLGLADQQLIIVTMFHENPSSTELANSVHPTGGALVVTIGVLPPIGRDNRVPQVAPLPPPPPPEPWYRRVFAFFGNWFY